MTEANGGGMGRLSKQEPRKPVPVMLVTTNNMRIEGDVYIPTDLRLVDHMNVAQMPFIAVTNARLFISSDEAPQECPLLLVNRNEILCVFPL